MCMFLRGGRSSGWKIANGDELSATLIILQNLLDRSLVLHFVNISAFPVHYFCKTREDQSENPITFTASLS